MCNVVFFENENAYHIFFKLFSYLFVIAISVNISYHKKHHIIRFVYNGTAWQLLSSNKLKRINAIQSAKDCYHLLLTVNCRLGFPMICRKLYELFLCRCISLPFINS